MAKRCLLTTSADSDIWLHTVALAQAFAAREIETVIAIVGAPPDPPRRRAAAARPGVQLIATGLPLDWRAASPDELEFSAQVLGAIARQVDADSVHLHTPALVGTARWPMPVVVAVHGCVGTWWRAVRGGALPPHLAWRAEATRAGIARADRVIAPSSCFAEALQACYGTVRPVDVVWYAGDFYAVSAERQPRALYAGRLWDEGQNVAALDAAAAAVPFPVSAAGALDGPDGARASIRHLRLLGVLDDDAFAAECARSAVFISVAGYEPFGAAVLQAAQAGCALVLSDIPTFRELWNDAAVFVGPDDVAPTLDRLLRDPVACADLGARAQARAGVYDVRRMVDAITAMHQQLIGGARVAA